MGAARKSKTPQERGALALAPWKAKCIQAVGDHHKPFFLKIIKPQTLHVV